MMGLHRELDVAAIAMRVYADLDGPMSGQSPQDSQFGKIVNTWKRKGSIAGSSSPRCARN